MKTILPSFSAEQADQGHSSEKKNYEFPIHPGPIKNAFKAREVAIAYEKWSHAWIKLAAVDDRLGVSMVSNYSEEEREQLRPGRQQDVIESRQAFKDAFAYKPRRAAAVKKCPAPASATEGHFFNAFSQNGQQLNLALNYEPSRLHHTHQLKAPARFALCTKKGGEPIEQNLYDVSQMDWALRQVENIKDRNVWIGQSTLKPNSINRRISSIYLLNAVWCDIDLKHPGKDYTGTLPQGDASRDGDAQRLATLLAQDLEDEGLPQPTCIIATGGGLCAKWIFSSAIAAAARPRWQSLQKHLNARIARIVAKAGELEWSWPVDAKATDAARILRLVGTHNPKWDAPCRIVWDRGQQFDFDYLADEILPYTRAEVLGFREQANCKPAQVQDWASNRARATALGLGSSKVALIEDEAARGLWAYRLELSKTIFDSRGGVGEGNRNNFFWPMANALAWSCGTTDQLTHELAALHQSYFHHTGWTRGEAMQAAGSVMRRLREPQGKGTGLYRMTHQTFLDSLEITVEESRGFGGSAASGGGRKQSETLNVGVMGFEKMRNLPFDTYLAETRRRQGEAGKVIGAHNLPTTTGQAERGRLGGTAKGLKNQDKRAQALAMASAGAIQAAIATALNVTDRTIRNWLKTGK